MSTLRKILERYSRDLISRGIVKPGKDTIVSIINIDLTEQGEGHFETHRIDWHAFTQSSDHPNIQDYLPMEVTEYETHEVKKGMRGRLVAEVKPSLVIQEPETAEPKQ